MFHLPLLLFPFSGRVGSTAGLLGLISTPLYLQGVAAYAEAAQTPSHSRILNLRQIWLKVEITLELPVGSKLIATSILPESSHKLAFHCCRKQSLIRWPISLKSCPLLSRALGWSNTYANPSLHADNVPHFHEPGVKVQCGHGL